MTTSQLQIIPDPVTGDLMVDVLAALDMNQHALMDQKVLDHGFVRILDVMPRLVPVECMNGDFSLADAARISYQKGTRKVSSDRGLVDHLVRNRHTSPIEMGELKFHLRMPIFVMRQHVRHRTASLNEESARYSELDSDFYVPEPAHWAINTAANKQATVQIDHGSVSGALPRFLHKQITKHNEISYKLYQLLLGNHAGRGEEDKYWDMLGVPAIAREQARMVLGVNIYTQCIWKIDLKNLMHYLSLRCDPHAQFEIRAIADPIRCVVAALFPASWASFEDHFMDGVNFAKSELVIVKALVMNTCDDTTDKANLLLHVFGLGWSYTRLVEFSKKLTKSKLVDDAKVASFLVAYKELLDSRK